MVGIDSSGELGQSQAPKTEKTENTPKVTKDLIDSFEAWKRHYDISVRAYKIKNGQSPVHEGFTQIKGLDQTLHPANLNKIGVTKNINKHTEAAFGLFVDYLYTNFPDALKDWVKRHDEEQEFLKDGNDSRIRKISEIAQQAIKKR